MAIRGIVSLPGCEGRAYHLGRSVAVFGLGFHGLATLCVLDLLEADAVYLFLASPGSMGSYPARTRENNKEVIDDRRINGILELPLRSVEICYRDLADTIGVHRAEEEITIVPMGPKPHVLASILLAMRFQEIACLRVSGILSPVDIEPTGDVVATRVVLSGQA